MYPFKYRLVTDEAQCGSMGRTRHLLRVHHGQEIGSPGGQDPMATPGLQGSMYMYAPGPCHSRCPSCDCDCVLWPCVTFFDRRLNPGEHPVHWLSGDFPRPCRGGS